MGMRRKRERDSLEWRVILGGGFMGTWMPVVGVRAILAGDVLLGVFFVACGVSLLFTAWVFWKHGSST